MSELLAIGLTGPLGAGRTAAAEHLSRKHGVATITLSSLLRDDPDEKVDTEELQRRGDQLRADEGEAALAAMALDAAQKEPGAGVVVFDGLKHPAEARHLAANADFYLVAVLARSETRWGRCSRAFGHDRTQFDAVDGRDSRETDRWGIAVDHGQRVADCIGLAHAIVWNDSPFLPGGTAPRNRGTLGEFREKIDALYRVLAQAETRPPTVMELRMSQAYAASLCSSCLKRKVGAVITNPDGRIISEGYNEVPTGQPTCLELNGRCYREMVREQDHEALVSAFRCGECGGDIDETLTCTQCGWQYGATLPKRPNLDYCRALHAEERAILHASRYGGVGIEGGILYTTTFPCALCAKKIVDCGLSQVVFGEPYHMREAEELLRDADLEVQQFEGFTHRAFNRVFQR